MGKNNILGAWGEALAAEYLRKKRYRILATGFRSRFGEIDIVAQSGGTLVFVEVKLRKSAAYARAMEYVDYKKQERIRSTALWYLAKNRLDVPVRFDVIEIYAPEGLDTVRPEINHMEDAFQ